MINVSEYYLASEAAERTRKKTSIPDYIESYEDMSTCIGIYLLRDEEEFNHISKIQENKDYTYVTIIEREEDLLVNALNAVMGELMEKNLAEKSAEYTQGASAYMGNTPCFNYVTATYHVNKAIPSLSFRDIYEILTPIVNQYHIKSNKAQDQFNSSFTSIYQSFYNQRDMTILSLLNKLYVPPYSF